MCLRRTGSENMPKIITNNTINLFFFKLQSAFCHFQTITFSECCLIKLLPYILLEKYINILALEMASPGNQQYSNCIGALSLYDCVCLQCFDAVGWAAGRASGL